MVPPPAFIATLDQLAQSWAASKPQTRHVLKTMSSTALQHLKNKAIAADDVALVKAALSGYPLATQRETQLRVLLLAAERGKLKVVDWCLRHERSRPNAPDLNRRRWRLDNALGAAVSGGHVGVVARVLEEYRKGHGSEVYLYSAMDTAMLKGHVDIGRLVAASMPQAGVDDVLNSAAYGQKTEFIDVCIALASQEAIRTTLLAVAEQNKDTSVRYLIPNVDPSVNADAFVWALEAKAWKAVELLAPWGTEEGLAQALANSPAVLPACQMHWQASLLASSMPKEADNGPSNPRKPRL